MKQIAPELMKRTDKWVHAQKGLDASHKHGKDPEGQHIKKEWLAIVDQLKKAPGGEEFSRVVDEIEANAPAFREEIARLVYEGNTDKASLEKALRKYGIEDKGVANGCYTCYACTVCVSCGACFACIVSGVAAASFLTTATNISYLTSIETNAM